VEKRKRTAMVSVRFRPGEDQAIRAAARAAGKNVSRFIADAALQEATAPKCAACGRLDDLAWVVVRGDQQPTPGGDRPPTVAFSPSPFNVTGPYRWQGWRCGSCCLRDYGMAAGWSAA
jgi:Protein of unknown function (DUF1778)